MFPGGCAEAARTHRILARFAGSFPALLSPPLPRPRRPHLRPRPRPRPRDPPAVPPPSPAVPAPPAGYPSAPGGVRTRVRRAPPRPARPGPAPASPQADWPARSPAPRPGLGPAECSASPCARRAPSGSRSRAEPPARVSTRLRARGEGGSLGPVAGLQSRAVRGGRTGTWALLGPGREGGRRLGSLPWTKYSREAVSLASSEGANGTVLLSGKFPALTQRPG